MLTCLPYNSFKPFLFSTSKSCNTTLFCVFTYYRNNIFYTTFSSLTHNEFKLLWFGNELEESVFWGCGLRCNIFNDRRLSFCTNLKCDFFCAVINFCNCGIIKFSIGQAQLYHITCFYTQNLTQIVKVFAINYNETIFILIFFYNQLSHRLLYRFFLCSFLSQKCLVLKLL